MQLVAIGAQDVFLTSNPQITFFKVVYRRHTNFSMESVIQTFNGTPAFNSKISSTIFRNGDLIYQMYVEVIIDVTPGSYDTGIDDGTGNGTNIFKLTHISNQKVGHLLLKNVDIDIGGQRIDKHYAQWLDIWADLTVTKEKLLGYQTMTQVRDLSITTTPPDAVGTPISRKLYIPLQFWFCRNPGLALPLIALQYHEVKVNIEIETSSVIIGSSTVTVNMVDLPIKGVDTTLVDQADPVVAGDVDITMSKMNLWVDYIYLDTDERRRFAQVSHEYLIEQLQFTGSDLTNKQGHILNFNHPIKELIWVEKNSTSNSIFSYNESQLAKLQLNGHDRFIERVGSYFTLVQPYQHHTNIPSSNIHIYSFAFNPEEHQPSGTCNMSRIDTATLSVTPNALSDTIYIYAVNYNVLRIMGGMGGLAYSN